MLIVTMIVWVLKIRQAQFRSNRVRLMFRLSFALIYNI